MLHAGLIEDNIIIIKTHFIAPSIKKNDRKALYKGKIQIRNIQP